MRGRTVATPYCFHGCSSETCDTEVGKNPLHALVPAPWWPTAETNNIVTVQSQSALDATVDIDIE